MPAKQPSPTSGPRSTEELHVYILNTDEAALIKSLRRRAGRSAQLRVTSLPAIRALQQQMTDWSLASLLDHVSEQTRGRIHLQVVDSLIARAERG